jgi:hypothetical protein
MWMDAKNNSESLTFGNIHVTKEAVYEFDGEKVIVSIEKADIKIITISFGRIAKRPITQFITGLLLCFIGSLGLLPLLNLLDKLLNGSDTLREPIFTATLWLFGPPLLIVGLWLLIGVCRKSHFLLVRTATGETKLPLGKCIPSEVLIAAGNLGYPVESANRKP